tara:strand:- start:6966 stop:8282 length:1317 start_codon:yes stop_codon:yes gene_type:complete
MRRLSVIGAGESGIGAALLAKKKGYKVFVSDNGKIIEKDILSQNNIEWEEEKHSISKISLSEEVIKSPGVPESTSIIKNIRQIGIPIISEIEFASRYTESKIIAVTGSNGKTTTVSLIGEILKKAGFDVLVAGNIGTGFARSIIKRDYKYIVLELSSFQLDGIKDFRADISIILNISADHLDRYDYDFNNYIQSKLRITINKKKEDVLIYNIDDMNIVDNLKTKCHTIPFSIHRNLDSCGAYLIGNQVNINLNNEKMTIQELGLQGKHNIYNSMAASIATRVLDVKDFIIRQSLQDFKNVEHRLEHVINVHGIEFINDSKATNINSVWFALESMEKKVVWIVGGVDKGNDYSELLDLVKEKVKAIVCIGENKEKLHKIFKTSVDNIVDASSMNEAVAYSYELAEKGDAVLLSPACASFDMFSNFEERGMKFKNSVRSL